MCYIVVVLRSSCCSAPSCSLTVFGTMFDCCFTSSTSISFFPLLVPFVFGTVVSHELTLNLVLFLQLIKLFLAGQG